MATTWIKPIHKSKSKSVAATLADAIGYADNPDKTNSFEYVKSYGCDYYTAANEFALSKQLYENRTGRGGRSGDIIAYHLRQSFMPGEITPQRALEVGYVLAEKFTHGRHAFVCAVHTDKKHIHCHIIFNAVNIDCERKFRNPIGSMKIIRRISDFLCAERGLSIVENPKKSRGIYRDWQDKNEPQSNRGKLQELIDKNIAADMMFEQFIANMEKAGCEVKRGKYLAFKLSGAERFIRVKSLGSDYTEQALRERCIGKRPTPKREYSASQNRPNLLIDIQAKISEGAGAGYVQWMKIFNLQTAARTLIFLKEQGIDSYDELCEQSSAASGNFSGLSKRIKEIETRQKEIAELQKQIGTYGKTREVYAKYKASGGSRNFYDIHAVDIILHRAAKKYFDGLGMKKLPSINQLKQEWAELDTERRKLYSGYKTARQNFTALETARANADVLLFGERKFQKSHDRDTR